MRTHDRLAVALPLAILAFCAAYQWAPSGPFYYPLEHQWSLDKLPNAIGMAWYGRSLWGVLAALLGGGLGWLVSRRVEDLSRRLTDALAAAALLALLTLVLNIVQHEFRHWGTWPFGL